jgi:NitT/TauT family transport system permease protein
MTAVTVPPNATQPGHTRTALRPRRRRRQRWFTSSRRSANVVRLLLAIAVIAGLWELIARFVITDRLILAPFSDVMVALGHEAGTGVLWKNIATTLLELAVAFPIAVVAGVVIGAVLASSRVLSQTLDPLLTAVYSLPIVALAPLFVAGLGFGLSSKVALILLISVFPVIANTEAGLRAADAGLVEMSHSFTATRTQTLKTVTLPFSIPFIVGGVRVAFARAIVGAIVAEFFGAVAGVGYAIMAASQTYATATLLAYVLVLGVLGFCSSIVLEAWEHRLAPWKEVDR